MLVPTDSPTGARNIRADLPHLPPEAPLAPTYATAKVVLDWVCALVLLIVTGPLLLLAALAIKLTSHGPALYTQTRLGRGGRHYTIYKLRTMCHDCERQSGAKWSTAGDPRVTRLGRFLRATHLDELPQLWNVLRGHMSLVGPRPERPEFLARLEREVPRYRERLRVRPGLTGLAQVQLPPDSDTPGVRRKVAHDLHYIERMGLWLDLRILISTAFQVVGLPFAFGRWLLQLPGGPEVEAEYERTAAAAAPTSPATHHPAPLAAAELQPA